MPKTISVMRGGKDTNNKELNFGGDEAVDLRGGTPLLDSAAGNQMEEEEEEGRRQHHGG